MSGTFFKFSWFHDWVDPEKHRAISFCLSTLTNENLGRIAPSRLCADIYSILGTRSHFSWRTYRKSLSLSKRVERKNQLSQNKIKALYTNLKFPVGCYCRLHATSNVSLQTLKAVLLVPLFLSLLTRVLFFLFLLGALGADIGRLLCCCCYFTSPCENILPSRFQFVHGCSYRFVFSFSFFHQESFGLLFQKKEWTLKKRRKHQ